MWGVALTAVFGACGEVPPAPGALGGDTTRTTVSAIYRASGLGAAGYTAVHLFDWRWDDIAVECESVLGPAGYKAVQLSPPNEHSRTPNQDWSMRYQPVSYALTRSRSGTEAEFVRMVERCRAVGVDVYVDAVLNHMTNFPSPGIGSAGSVYSKYRYPGLYDESDFHAPCAVSDYRVAAEVQDCELYSLPDLRTERPRVRRVLAEYLTGLTRLGVAGFRIDAAKHMQQADVNAILDSVNTAARLTGRPVPYVFLEISAGRDEAVQPADYFGVGYASGGAADITEFTYRGIADKFTRRGGQSLHQLSPTGPAGARFTESAWGLLPSDKAVVFLQNHDTQRECGLGYQQGDVFRLAHVFMLAHPYGYPFVLSGFAFRCPEQRSEGPPRDAEGWTTRVACASDWSGAVTGEWVCEHRDPVIRAMVGFRRRTAGAPITQWWDNGANAIAFSRGAQGFVAINRESQPVEAVVRTALPAGRYCDLLSGGGAGGGCRGEVVEVRADGTIALRLPADRALAIDVSVRRE
jgi:alpha-amylase